MEAREIFQQMADVVSEALEDAQVSLPQTDPNVVLANVLNAAYIAAGLVAVGFVIYGGITYTTSVGDPAKTKKALMSILYAAIGLIVVLVAAAITNFVLGTL